MTPERVPVSQAALIAGLPKRTLQDLAARGAIPGAGKPAGRWTFDVRLLRQWAARVERKRECRTSTTVAASGGRVSRFAGSNIDAAYERALGLLRRDA